MGIHRATPRIGPRGPTGPIGPQGPAGPIPDTIWTNVEVDLSGELSHAWQMGRRFGSLGAGDSNFNTPRQVAVSPVSDHILIADSANARLVRRALSTGAFVDAIAGMAGIRGVAIDPAGNIYTYKGTSGEKYNPSLALLWTGFSPLFAAGHVATDGTSVFYIDVDPVGGIHRVVKRLASTGAAGSPSTLGSLGSGDGQFGSGGPIGACVAGTRAWFTDPGNSRAQEFVASTGAFVSEITGLTAPTGITFAAGKLYVLNAGADEVRIYEAASGDLLDSFVPGVSAASEGIAVDGRGAVWITDAAAHTLTEWLPPTTTPLRLSGRVTIATSGQTPGKHVAAMPAPGPWTGKGSRADEAEMDQIVASGVVTSPTTIDLYWHSPTWVRGMATFAYVVSN